MTITDTITTQVKSLVEDVKALPASFKKVDVAELKAQAQTLAQSALGQATGVYADLTKKGEELVSKAKCLKVDDIKKTVEGLKGKAEDVAEDAQKKAETFAEDAQKKAESFVADTSKKAEEFVAEAKATVNKVTKKAPAAKPAAKKPAAKPAAKKPAAKPAAKKAPAKKA